MVVRYWVHLYEEVANFPGDHKGRQGNLQQPDSAPIL